MTNTYWRQSRICFPSIPKIAVVKKFNNMVKLKLAKIIHSVLNNKISNLYFGFSRVENFSFHTGNSTMCKLLHFCKNQENQLCLSQAHAFLKYCLIVAETMFLVEKSQKLHLIGICSIFKNY